MNHIYTRPRASIVAFSYYTEYLHEEEPSVNSELLEIRTLTRKSSAVQAHRLHVKCQMHIEVLSTLYIVHIKQIVVSVEF